MVVMSPPVAGLFYCGLEGAEARRSRRGRAKPHRGEPGRVELVEPAVADRAVDDQAGVLQHLQVLGDRRPADRQPRRQLPHRQRTGREAFADRPPGGVSECVENLVRSHLR